MQPGRRPPSILESLLKWILGAFFAVDLLMVAPAFASSLGVELPGAFPRVEPAALITGGSALADGLAQALGVNAADLPPRPPQASSGGSGAIISIYAPMAATATALPVDQDEPGLGPTEQETAATPAPGDPAGPSPTLNAEISETPTLAPSAVASLTSTSVFSPTPTATSLYSQTPVATASGTAYASPTPTLTRTKTKTPTLRPTYAPSSTRTPTRTRTLTPTRTKTKTATSPPQPTATSVLDGSYFVSPDGDDSNPGTSDRPWRTLSRVTATKFLPGDVISFQRGGSWSGALVIDDSGVSGNPITFTTYGTGSRPVLTNPGSAGSRSPIDVRADWVVVEGFLVQDAYEAGVYISDGSDHNVIRDIEVTDTGIGISIRGRYNLITGNYLHDLHMVVNTPGGNDDYGAVGVDLNGGSDNEISYNRAVNCRASSHDYGHDGGAVELFATADRNYIHHNWATTSEGFIEVGGGSARDNVVAYNVSINNGTFSSIHLSGEFASDVVNFRIENNTIVETPTDDQDWVVLGWLGSPTSKTALVRNNIFWVERGSGPTEGLQRISNVAGFTHEHNVYQLIGQLALGFDPGPGESLADPLFVDLGDTDFHLQPASPAVDSGLDLGYSRDFDDRSVPLGAAPDIGAFEHQP